MLAVAQISLLFFGIVLQIPTFATFEPFYIDGMQFVVFLVLIFCLLYLPNSSGPIFTVDMSSWQFDFEAII